MAISAPTSRPRSETDRPVIRRIRDEFHFGTRAAGDGSVAPAQLSRRLDRSAAGAAYRALAARATRRTEIARETWEFIDERSIRLLPEGRKFEPVKIYELWYEATGPKVLGIGYASVRDLVSFFRYRSANRGGIPNPLLSGMSEIRHALAFGVSQSGRFLRHFLELGHERRRDWAAGVRRRLQPRRRRRQSLRQSPLRHARPHRDPARGPALSRKLVPVQHGANGRSGVGPKPVGC